MWWTAAPRRPDSHANSHTNQWHYSNSDADADPHPDRWRYGNSNADADHHPHW